MHGVLRLNDAMAAGWTDEDVVRRWGRLFPPRGKNRVALPVTDAWVAAQLANAAWVAETRKRLNSLGWFMKCLKEPLSRRANREDQCRGTFFEARFKSIAILDEEALLTTLAYVDLNPLSAGISLKGYLELLDWSGRLLRGGKSRIPADVAGILDRLGSSPDVWQHRLEKLCETDRLFGVVFSTQRRRIRKLAASRGVRKLSNLNGCSG